MTRMNSNLMSPASFQSTATSVAVVPNRSSTSKFVMAAFPPVLTTAIFSISSTSTNWSVDLKRIFCGTSPN